MNPNTLCSYLLETKNIQSDFVVMEKKINMLDSIWSYCNKSDDQVDNWTQVLGLSTGAFNHLAAAARKRRWLPPKYVKILLS